MIRRMESFRKAMEASARANGLIKAGESISLLATAGCISPRMTFERERHIKRDFGQPPFLGTRKIFSVWSSEVPKKSGARLKK